ncbi:MAG: hypothetical protein JSS27_00950 [Planctomycetes bacterium]|nr:hypothetical protein [Planctomycetota bacterium]
MIAKLRGCKIARQMANERKESLKSKASRDRFDAEAAALSKQVDDLESQLAVAVYAVCDRVAGKFIREELREHADDFTQTAVLHVVRNIHKYDRFRKRSLLGWITQVVKNVFRMEARRLNTQAAHFARYCESQPAGEPFEYAGRKHGQEAAGEPVGDDDAWLFDIDDE